MVAAACAAGTGRRVVAHRRHSAGKGNWRSSGGRCVFLMMAFHMSFSVMDTNQSWSMVSAVIMGRGHCAMFMRTLSLGRSQCSFLPSKHTLRARGVGGRAQCFDMCMCNVCSSDLRPPLSRAGCTNRCTTCVFTLTNGAAAHAVGRAAQAGRRAPCAWVREVCGNVDDNVRRLCHHDRPARIRGAHQHTQAWKGTPLEKDTKSPPS